MICGFWVYEKDDYGYGVTIFLYFLRRSRAGLFWLQVMRVLLE